MASLSFAASPCELPFVGSCPGKQLEKAAFSGEVSINGGRMDQKQRELHWQMIYLQVRSSHESSSRSLWSPETWPCSSIIASISSSAGTLISPWVTEFKKQRKTGAICQLYCDAVPCLPSAHVFKHQLLKWLTTKCLKRRTFTHRKPLKKSVNLSNKTQAVPNLRMFDLTLLHLQFSAWGCSCLHAYLHTFKGHWYKQASSGQHHVSEEPDERFQPSITIDRFGLPRSDSSSLNTSRLCWSYFEPQRNTAKCCRNTFNFM